MSRFIALRVGMGDAFYLERKDNHILVDGGSGKKNIVNLVKQYTDKLDIVVCTHNDADHANGIIGLLESAFPIKEVWIPAKWTYKLKELFENPHVFVKELVEEVYSLQVDAKKLEDLDLDLDLDLDAYRTIEEDRDQEGEKNFFPLDDLLDKDNQNISTRYFYYKYRRLGFRLHSSKWSLFIDALKAAKRIKNIIDLAYKQRGCKIRFFEFGSIVNGGIKDLLEPVNSLEIVQLQTHAISSLQYLALSVANKESLVFITNETEQEPAVIFTADSDLNFTLSNCNGIKRSPIVTSPHHGSDHNQNAYQVINGLFLNSVIVPIWIRSDCKSNKRPGKVYKQQLLRACTFCNSNLQVKQDIVINAVATKWHFSTNLCTCV